MEESCYPSHLNIGESTTAILYPVLGPPGQQRYWEAGKGQSAG